MTTSWHAVVNALGHVDLFETTADAREWAAKWDRTHPRLAPHRPAILVEQGSEVISEAAIEELYKVYQAVCSIESPEAALIHGGVTMCLEALGLMEAFRLEAEKKDGR